MKVRCLSTGITGRKPHFTIGEIYEYDGRNITDDQGHRWGNSPMSLDQWNRMKGDLVGQFEEIKEENMTYQYQPGDVVRIRRDLTEGKKYGNITLLSGMSDLRGELRTVIMQDDRSLRFESTICWWANEMVEPASITFDWPQFKQARFAVKCASEQEAERFVRFIYDECGYTNPHGHTVRPRNLLYDPNNMYCMVNPDSFYSVGEHYLDPRPVLIIPFSAFKNFKEETTMYNLEQAEAKLRQAEDEQESATRKVTEARRMIEEAQREAAKPKWPGLRKGDSYWIIDQEDDGYEPDETTWDDDRTDRARLAAGQIFTTESECQHFCDMLNYQLLVRGKALQMDGLLGYGKDVDSSKSPHVMFTGNCGFGATRITEWPNHQPCTPIITSKCADELRGDRELVAAAKKAWNK